MVTSGNKFPDWKGLISGGLTRGFTKFDMSFPSVSVSIFDCILPTLAPLVGSQPFVLNSSSAEKICIKAILHSKKCVML